MSINAFGIVNIYLLISMVFATHVIYIRWMNGRTVEIGSLLWVFNRKRVRQCR